MFRHIHILNKFAQALALRIGYRRPATKESGEFLEKLRFSDATLHDTSE
jgi:hypothetical protein